MKKPIKIPCILILNEDEIEQAEKLAIEAPEEVKVEHEIKFFNIDILETPYVKPTGSGLKSKCYVFSNGHSFCATITEQEIEARMIEAGWYD